MDAGFFGKAPLLLHRGMSPRVAVKEKISGLLEVTAVFAQTDPKKADLRTYLAVACIGLGNARHTDDKHKFNTKWYLGALDFVAPDGNISIRARALIGLGNARYTDKVHRENTDWYIEGLALLKENGNSHYPRQSFTCKTS